MDGSEFLNLAIRLSSGSTKPEWRSAVSRAYYGAIHMAREFLVSCGVTLPKTADVDAERRNRCARAIYFLDFKLKFSVFAPDLISRVRLAATSSKWISSVMSTIGLFGSPA